LRTSQSSVRRLIEGSPKNSTSTVPIMPWGASDQVQRCADFVEQ
jgi:CreA protein